MDKYNATMEFHFHFQVQIIIKIKWASTDRSLLGSQYSNFPGHQDLHGVQKLQILKFSNN